MNTVTKQTPGFCQSVSIPLFMVPSNENWLTPLPTNSRHLSTYAYDKFWMSFGPKIFSASNQQWHRVEMGLD